MSEWNNINGGNNSEENIYYCSTVYFTETSQSLNNYAASHRGISTKMSSNYNGEFVFDRARANLALRATALQICVRVTNGEIGACIDVKEHIRTVGQSQIDSLMAESLDEDFATCINGLRNNFVDVKYV